MKILSYEEYQEKMKNLKTSKDVNTPLRELVAPTLQAMLEAFLQTHLMPEIVFWLHPKTDCNYSHAIQVQVY